MTARTVSVTVKEAEQKKYRQALRHFALAPVSDEKYEKVVYTDWQEEKIRRFARENGFPFRIDDSYSSRSSDYRRRFFAANPPDIGKRYICVYCGKLMTRQKTTVDHLYPVYRVSQDIRLQKKMKRKGITNVNDVSNLVPACASCNRKKSAKMGKWITKGRIGRHRWVWILRWTVRYTLLLVAVFLVLYCIFPQLRPDWLQQWLNSLVLLIINGLRAVIRFLANIVH